MLSVSIYHCLPFYFLTYCNSYTHSNLKPYPISEWAPKLCLWEYLYQHLYLQFSISMPLTAVQAPSPCPGFWGSFLPPSFLWFFSCSHAGSAKLRKFRWATISWLFISGFSLPLIFFPRNTFLTSGYACCPIPTTSISLYSFTQTTLQPLVSCLLFANMPKVNLLKKNLPLILSYLPNYFSIESSLNSETSQSDLLWYSLLLYHHTVFIAFHRLHPLSTIPLQHL